MILPEEYNRLGIQHVSQGEYEEAEFCFVRAATANFCETACIHYHNAGKVCMEQMKLEEAESYFLKAIWDNPDHAATHYDLSLVLGLQGKWKEFFKEYEWRNEYFSDLKYYRELYTFGRKVFVCKNGHYRSFLMLPT